MEQSERQVFELLDLGYGRLHDGARHRRRRARPGRRGAAAPGRHARRDEVPAHRRRATSSDTGRQAEIVEVKGSVELAPLTGLVEAIVDLTATGTTLRENGLVVREEIVDLDGAADRQPGRPQAQGGGDRRGRGGAAWRVERFALGDPGAGRGGACGALAPGAASVADAVARDRRRRARARRRCAARATSSASTASRGPLRVRRRRARGRARRPRPRRPRRPRGGDRQRRARSPSPGATTSARSLLPAGPGRPPARGARAPRGDLRPRRPRAVPVDRRHGRRDRARGRRRGGRRLRARARTR